MKRINQIILISSLLFNTFSSMTEVQATSSEKVSNDETTEKYENKKHLVDTVTEKEEESFNVKSEAIVEQNMKKLNPYIQLPQENFKEESFPKWMNKQIQAVFYQTEQQLLIYVDKKNYDSIFGIQV